MPRLTRSRRQTSARQHKSIRGRLEIWKMNEAFDHALEGGEKKGPDEEKKKTKRREMTENPLLAGVNRDGGRKMVDKKKAN